MPQMPALRVVPLADIRRHEEIDPLRVDKLVGRIEVEGIQVNPMMCCATPEGELVLLDGATRTESLRRMGLEHAVVQMVEPAGVTLETWHHVVRGCSPDDVIEAIESSESLHFGDSSGQPILHANDGRSGQVTGNGLSPNATLSSLVACYVGRWTVDRATDPSLESVRWSFPDWAVVAEFPTLTVEDVMTAAVTNDLLPAGITRFLVPERALRLNVSLDLLGSDLSRDQKQDSLDEMLEERARDGRVRRYDETVYILDD